MEEICKECTARNDGCDQVPTWKDGCAGFTNMPLHDPMARVLLDPRYFKDCEDARNCAVQLLSSLSPTIKPMENFSGIMAQISHWCYGARKDIGDLMYVLRGALEELEDMPQDRIKIKRLQETLDRLECWPASKEIKNAL